MEKNLPMAIRKTSIKKFSGDWETVLEKFYQLLILL